MPHSYNIVIQKTPLNNQRKGNKTKFSFCSFIIITLKCLLRTVVQGVLFLCNVSIQICISTMSLWATICLFFTKNETEFFYVWWWWWCFYYDKKIYQLNIQEPSVVFQQQKIGGGREKKVHTNLLRCTMLAGVFKEREQKWKQKSLGEKTGASSSLILFSCDSSCLGSPLSNRTSNQLLANTI